MLLLIAIRAAARRLPRGTPLAAALLVTMALAALSCASRRPAPRGTSAPPDPPLVRLQAREPADKFEGDFRDRLGEALPGTRHRAIVDLTEQVDLRTLDGELRAAARGKAARGATVIGALERVAERQQAMLRPRLDRLIEAGRLDYVRPVAIVNRLLVEGQAAALLELAQWPEVARVAPDWTSSRNPGREKPPSELPAPAAQEFTSWAIGAMGAQRLWSRGLTGEGVVVAVIDTGVYGEHEQLEGRGLEGSRGWFDPVQGRPSPYDSHGHGTGVLSVAVGGNPNGRLVGVAPGARWAAALGNWTNHYSRWRMSESADWVLRTARPDVLVNAWSDDRDECGDFDLPFINAWKASGIFVVFPAGNAGPDPATGEAPASLAGTLPSGGPVFSVAAIARGGDPHPTSSRGPSRCQSPAFPSVGAPGGDVPHAMPGHPDAYGVGSGTSLAAGLVGGAAALLLQADPGLLPEEIEDLLERSALDLPPAGRDDALGSGAVDLPAALALLESRRRSAPQPERKRGGVRHPAPN